MRPALMILADDPAQGIAGLTQEQAAVEALLVRALDQARQVPGVGRLLLFHPAEAEGRLAARALGFRMWPQDGASLGERYRNAFRQAVELGYEGGILVDLTVPSFPVERIAEAAALLEEHHGAIAADGQGGIALLALQEPQPTLFSGPDKPTYDEFCTRATQQRVQLVKLPEHPAITPEDLALANW
ncbi:MAG TPA: DUF2064 domain-containing protein [Acidimicrobiales bacterium]|nr:DUF2064 domain-containing protein [Acidimicrobiales bacterium]